MGKISFKGLGTKIKAFCKGFVAHWNKPYDGQYIPNKEFIAFSVGGMGVHALCRIQGYLTLTTGMWLAYIYGVTPSEIMILGTVLSVLNILKSPLISSLVDNTQTKRGKFIPYLMWLPFPLVGLYACCLFIPWQFNNHIVQIVIFGIIFFITSVVQGLYMSAYSNLAQVMTPNQNERTTKLFSLGAFMYNLGPSILDILFPILASLFALKAADNTTIVEGINRAISFRILVPIFSIVFASVGMLVPLFCKERLIVAKDYKAKVPFKTGFKATVRNKYFWIINTSNILAFARGSITGLVTWTVLYVMRNEAVSGLINALEGTAAVPGMLLAPVLIKKFGSKKITMTVYTIGAVLCVPMFFICSESLFASQHLLASWLIIIIIYLTNLANGTLTVTQPKLNSEMLDYEQLRSGLRLDGFMANFGGMYTTIFGMGTGLIVPLMQERLGLGGDYSILHQASVSSRIYRFMAIAAFGSTLLALIPFFWYDMTEAKHKEILEKLKEVAEKHNEELAAEGYTGELYEGSVDFSAEEIEHLHEEEKLEEQAIDAEKQTEDNDESDFFEE